MEESFRMLYAVVMLISGVSCTALTILLYFLFFYLKRKIEWLFYEMWGDRDGRK